MSPSSVHLRQLYDTLFAQGAQAALTGQLVPDPHLRHPTADTRRGLTLLIPVAPAVAAATADTLADLRTADPTLYYYPAPDLHLTLLTPLTGQPNQQLPTTLAQTYVAALREVLHDAPAFSIDFAGLTFTPAAVLLQGYPEPQLQQLREHVRQCLQEAALPLHERYRSISAHTTVVRFPVLPAHPGALVEYVAARRETPVRRQSVTELLLVWNDWYNRRERSRLLARLALAPK